MMRCRTTALLKRCRFLVAPFMLLCVVSSFTVLVHWQAISIYMGFTVRDTSRITWRDPTLRNILVNDSTAKALEKKVRILCLVPTTPGNEMTKARAVNNTWGSRCNKLLFVYTRHRSVFDHISLNVSDGREHLTAKTMEGFRYVHKHFTDFDFIVKADDDCYLILENLRFLLSKFDPNEPSYLGYHFKFNVRNGYMSGGGSYVLSKAALRMLVEQGLTPQVGCVLDSADEDVEVGACMEKLGVMCYVTHDKFGRDAFHPNSLHQNIIGPMSWYLRDYPTRPMKAGPECCSQYSISFHYVTPDMMYIVDTLLYRISVHGREQVPQEQKDDMFFKKVSVIKHKSKDEIFVRQGSIFNPAPNYIPGEND